METKDGPREGGEETEDGERRVSEAELVTSGVAPSPEDGRVSSRGEYLVPIPASHAYKIWIAVGSCIVLRGLVGRQMNLALHFATNG